jgi:hypothetical protein
MAQNSFLARFMLLGSFFTWIYFLLEPFFFNIAGKARFFGNKVLEQR